MEEKDTKKGSLSNFPTRKAIALAMTVTYIILTGYVTFIRKELPGEFVTVAGMVISYYFAKSTALDKPEK